MPDIVLRGCAPTPLASYLKTLGIFRLIAEQADSQATIAWHNEQPVLRTVKNEHDVITFFLKKYVPTPIIAPWNGGSGFYPVGKREGIQSIVSSKASRFSSYSEAIRISKSILDETFHHFGTEPEIVEAIRRDDISCTQSISLTKELRDKLQKDRRQCKELLLKQLRSSLPDNVIEWMDAAVLLTSEKSHFPPLLGTGGNDGRLDFTNNFMQRLVMLFDMDSGEPKFYAEESLNGALFGANVRGTTEGVVGQFDPGSAGGYNATTGFEGKSHINPWDFVLMLEGTLLLSATATRRTEATSAALAYPFTVRPSGSGSGASNLGDESAARAEFWAPVWKRFTSLPELQVLLGEGRATLKRSTAYNGLDFARSVASLGVDRGIKHFHRYAFMQRSGKAYFAVSLDRIQVPKYPRPDLVSDFEQDGWLRRLRDLSRGKKASGRLVSLMHRFEDSLFELTKSLTPSRVQMVLIIFGEIMVYLGNSRYEEMLRAPKILSPKWIRYANDDSPEFCIAVALASIGVKGAMQKCDFPMRRHFVPLNKESHQLLPKGTSSPDCIWSGGTLEGRLTAILSRRLMDSKRLKLSEKHLLTACVGTDLDSCAIGANLDSISAFLLGQTDDTRITRLLPGLVWVKPELPHNPDNEGDRPLPLSYALLKVVFSPDNMLKKAKYLSKEGDMPIPPNLIATLRKGRVKEALEMAKVRARGSRFPITFTNTNGGAIDGDRLAAALLIPVNQKTLESLLKQAYPQNNFSTNLTKEI